MNVLDNMLLVLLAGQSNMSGRGIAEPDDLTVIPGLYAFGKDLVWRDAVEPVTKDRSFVGAFLPGDEKIVSADPWDNINPDEVREKGGFVRGVGPGRTFGRLLLAANPGRSVGLIPTSVGGTPISSWEPGGTDVYDDSAHPYDESIRTAREALKFGKIAAVLWHQGEGDADRNTPDYKERLCAVIRRFRSDLSLEGVPFILGELGDFYEDPIMRNVPMVDGAMYAAARELPMVGVAKAKGLPHRGDRLHFSTAGAHRLGENYFREYQRLTGKA